MLKDAEDGIINLILVKDLSRFGRDHIEVDHYVEDVFPVLGVRFIALMDGIDSETGAEMLPFRSLMNDYYLKDISRKIKSTFHAQARAGNYIGWFVAYGYKKDPAKHGRLMVDPYAAEVVNRIFDLRLKQFSYTKIAGALNADGILAPRTYYFQSEGKSNPFQVMDVWRDSTVRRILKNEVYLGHSIKMKTKSVSYKRNKRIHRPVEEWIRVENTHEPIITQEIWDAVQVVNLKRNSTNTDRIKEQSLFSGFLFCDNGHRMCAGIDNQRYDNKIKQYRYYYCSLHKQSGYAACSWHTISELSLLQMIRDDMEKQLECIEVDESRIAAEIQKRLAKTSFADAEKELRRLSEKRGKLYEHIMEMYEDRLTGAIDLDTFMTLSNYAEAAQAEVSAEHERLTAAVETAKLQMFDTHQWFSALRPYLTMETINYDVLHSMINKIEIGEHKENGMNKIRRQTVKIYYRFAGYIF